MGNATTVCSDKTGTLTENKMTVVSASIADKKITFNHNLKNSCAQVNSTALNLAIENMAVNSTAFEGKDADGQMKLIGSTTECALLGFVEKLGHCYQEKRASSQCVNVYPFNSTVKSMTTVIELNESNVASENASQYRVFSKGAPESILQSCTYYLDASGRVKPLNGYVRVNQEMLISSYAGRSLRTLALAYRDVDAIAFQGKKKKHCLLFRNININIYFSL